MPWVWDCESCGAMIPGEPFGESPYRQCESGCCGADGCIACIGADGYCRNRTLCNRDDDERDDPDENSPN